MEAAQPSETFILPHHHTAS